jgi:rhamnosyltransferase
VNNIVAIIISYKDTNALIATVIAIKDQVNQVIVIDNGSGNDFESGLQSVEQLKNIICIRLIKNLGIAYALNEGIKQAKQLDAQWVITLDQDSLAHENMVAELFRVAISNVKIGIVAPALNHTFQDNTNNELLVAITSGNLINIKVYDSVLYNDGYFIDSVDFDFCLKVKSAGWSIVQSNGAFLEHRLGISKKINFFGINFTYIFHSPLRRYYIFRNHIFLIRDHFKKHPIFLIKKTFFLFKIFTAIILFDTKKKLNVKMIFKGLIDGFKGNIGPFKE